MMETRLVTAATSMVRGLGHVHRYAWLALPATQPRPFSRRQSIA